MKKQIKREYDVFNMETGEWEIRTMTHEQYNDALLKVETNSDELNAEYEVISRIISQKMGLVSIEKENMD
jgi:hypothetical protein